MEVLQGEDGSLRWDLTALKQAGEAAGRSGCSGSCPASPTMRALVYLLSPNGVGHGQMKSGRGWAEANSARSPVPRPLRPPPTSGAGLWSPQRSLTVLKMNMFLSPVAFRELSPCGLSLLNILSALHGVAVGDRLLSASEFCVKKIIITAEYNRKRKEIESR